MLQLNDSLRISEVRYVLKTKIRNLIEKSMKVLVLVQQITSVKQKQDGMDTRSQIKILNQMNTLEIFLITNLIGRYFSRHLQA